MSAAWRVCVETELGAQTFLGALSAAACWDIESETERSPSTRAETGRPVEVRPTERRLAGTTSERCSCCSRSGGLWTAVLSPGRRPALGNGDQLRQRGLLRL